MASEQKRQGERQGEREPSAMARSGEGERGLASRQYYDPFSMLESLFERMQRDVFGPSLFGGMMPFRRSEGESGGVRVPRVQMRDTGEALELTAELPGIEGNDLKVEVEDDVLTISGEAHTQREEEGSRMERSFSFYRQVALPDGLDTEQPQASYRNGMLTIRFPKRAQRANARQIPVSTEPGTGSQGGQPQKKDRAA